MVANFKRDLIEILVYSINFVEYFHGMIVKIFVSTRVVHITGYT